MCNYEISLSIFFYFLHDIFLKLIITTVENNLLQNM
jgi:hypothetical protein